MLAIQLEWYLPSAVGARPLAACKYIRERRGLSNYLYVAPTKRLLKQTRQTLEDLGVRADVIDGDNQPRVNAAITSALKDAPSEGAVLLITWKAYADLSYFHGPEFWTRIIDEVPQLDVFRPYTLPFNHRFLSDHIEIRRSVNEHISEVKAKDYWALKHFLGKPRDDVHELFRKLFQDLLSPNKVVYVASESWTRITEHKVISKDEEQNRIFFLTLLRPNLFQDAILLGANIDKSMVHDWLSGPLFGPSALFQEWRADVVRPQVSRHEEKRPYFPPPPETGVSSFFGTSLGCFLGVGIHKICNATRPSSGDPSARGPNLGQTSGGQSHDKNRVVDVLARLRCAALVGTNTALCDFRFWKKQK